MSNVYANAPGLSDGRRSLPDTVLQIGDDGWRTASQRPMKSPLVRRPAWDRTGSTNQLFLQDAGQTVDVLTGNMTAMRMGVGVFISGVKGH